MHLQTLRFPIFMAILLTAEVCAIIRTECPIACECDQEEKKVECTHRHWTELPNLPEGSNYLKVRGADLMTLRSPVGCNSYAEVTTLEFQQNMISSVASDAFKCMPRLKSLTIETNLIRKVPHKLFQSLQNLRNVSFEHNRLTVDIFHELCMIQHLEKITLSNNLMTIQMNTLECLEFLERLSYVDLRRNIISGPIKLVLQPLRNVTHYVSVKDCKITSLENDTFAGFKLQILDLSYNRIQHIPRHAFRNMTRLLKLDLSSTDISDTYGWFEDLTVQEIDLSSNLLNNVPFITSTMQVVTLQFKPSTTLKRGAISNLDNLVELKIVQVYNVERQALFNLSKLEILHIECFPGRELVNLLLDIVLCPLKKLYLIANSLFILNNTFEVFTRNTIENLHLPSSKIHKIVPGAFQKLVNLQELNLGANYLSEILPFTFTGLIKLVYLSLEHNKLVKLHSNAFHGLQSLKELFLNGNSLKLFDGELAGLQTTPLTWLNLERNKLSHCSLRNIVTLEKTNLNSNYIKTLSSQDFQNLNSLRSLTIALNPLLNIEEEALLDLGNLTDLNLGTGPNIKVLLLLGEKKSLKFLGLGGTDLGHYLYPEIWEKAYNLEHLDINNCKITELVPGMFSSLHHLTELDAHSNQISLLNPTAFKNVSSLLKLNLDDNKLTFVNWESFVNVPHLRLLSLANNPIQCTCEVLWIVQALRTNLVFMQNVDKTICALPVPVHNKKVQALDLKLSDCDDRWKELFKLVGAGAGVELALVIAYVVWRYRWRIRYTLFLARTGIGRFEEMHDDHEYVYDAFVCYSSKDLPWVKDTLLPNIDAEPLVTRDINYASMTATGWQEYLL